MAHARREKKVMPLSMNTDEAADRLGMGRSKFLELAASHPAYHPDGRNGKDPRWSGELLELIEFALRITPQGVREMSDEEALRARCGMARKRRCAYLEAGEAIA